jgi:pyrimidine-nucleoside phosphorylase
MNEPLGMKVGNWLEIEECIDALNGNGPDDLMEVTHQLCGTMIHLGKKAETIEKGIEISKSMIQSGKAKDKFLEIVEEQNGNTAIINAPESYPKSKFKVDVQAESDGYIQSINALDIGLIAVSLGAGRMRSEDVIDPKAGIAFHKKSGLKIKTGEPVLTFYTDKESIIESAKTRLARAVKIGDNPPDPEPLIIQYLDKTYLE